MIDKKFLSGKEKEIREQADTLGDSMAQGHPIYLDADVLADIADYYAMNREPDKMRQVVEYGLYLHPDNTDLLIQKAYMHLDLNELDLSEETMRKIGEKSTDVTLLHAFIEYKRGNEALAMELIQPLLERRDPDDDYPLANILLDFKHPDRALDLMLSSDKDPEEQEYMEIMAACYQDMGDAEKAIVWYNRLIDLQPYAARYWKEIANCYCDQEEYGKAIEACDFALTTDEEFADAYLIKGYCYQQLGNLQKANQCHKKAVELGAMDKGFGCFVDAISHALKSQWEEAYQSMLEFLKKADKEEVAYYPYGLTAIASYLIHMGRIKEARDYTEQALSQWPDFCEAWRMKAYILANGGQTQKAIEAWDHMLSLDTCYTEDKVNTGMDNLHFRLYERAYQLFLSIKEGGESYRGLASLLLITALLTERPQEARLFNQEMDEPLSEASLKQIGQTLDHFKESPLLDELIEDLIEKLNPEASRDYDDTIELNSLLTPNR